MAVDSFTNLRATIGDFLNRSDLATDQADGTTVVEKFIAFAEAEFNRRLRVRGMVNRTSLSVTNQFTNLSSNLDADFLDIRNISLEPTSGGPIVLEYKSPQAMDEFRYARGGASGRPIVYSMLG